jgi:hypothetical protein
MEEVLRLWRSGRQTVQQDEVLALRVEVREKRRVVRRCERELQRREPRQFASQEVHLVLQPRQLALWLVSVPRVSHSVQHEVLLAISPLTQQSLPVS